MKKLTKEKLIDDAKYICIGLFFGTLSLLIILCYGNFLTAKFEAITKIALLTSSNNDCRIDNLSALDEDSNGTGKIFLLNIYNQDSTISHLVVCDKDDLLIDNNNVILDGVCDFNNLEINATLGTLKYKKLVEIHVKEYDLTKTILYPDALDDNLELATEGIKYSKIFLNTLKK